MIFDTKAFCKWAVENGYRKGLVIDRIDNDKGYSPGNCRFTTKSVNAANKSKLARNTSGYIGASYFKGKYQCTITVQKKCKFLGLFDTALEAAIVRDQYIVDNNLPHMLNGVL